MTPEKWSYANKHEGKKMKTMQFSTSGMMPCKAGKHTILTLLLISILVSPNVSAQDYTQWHLPQGAKARIGERPDIWQYRLFAR